MPTRQSDGSEFLTTLVQPLAAVSAPLAASALELLPAMLGQLSDAEAARWIDRCRRLSTCGWRSAESAEAFARVSPFLLQRAGAAGLWQWSDYGETLARTSAAAASSFFRSARSFLQQAPAGALQQWVEDGRWYLQQHPSFAALAETYFEISPAVYAGYSPASAHVWGELGHRFARTGWRPAGAFLSLSRRLAEHAPDVDLAPAWQQAGRMLPQAGDLALEYLEHYPDYAQRFGAAGVAAMRGVVDELLAPQISDVGEFLRRVGSTLMLSPPAECLQTLEWCRQISAVSHAGALAFLDRVGALRGRLTDRALQEWIGAGIDNARRREAAAEPWFALESATALDNLAALQKRVEFTAVEPVLRLYANAILGRRMGLETSDSLPPDMPRAGEGLPATDGAAIYVPPRMDVFDDAAENFGAYKVTVLHQAGYYESGTFSFE
ncbi:MAG: hypothetical protein OXP66_18125, partial [Candidatus Tectomicrobia bacterium]|nr:hypothetical protein [Candidatus Tectomicrobia bacterium]